MTIVVAREPNIYVTEDQLRRFKDEYHKFCQYYCGTPPSFESFIRSRLKEAEMMDRGSQ